MHIQNRVHTQLPVSSLSFKSDRPETQTPQASSESHIVRDSVATAVFGGVAAAGLATVGMGIGTAGSLVGSAALAGLALGSDEFHFDRAGDVCLLAGVSACLLAGSAMRATGVVGAGIAGMASFAALAILSRRD